MQKLFSNQEKKVLSQVNKSEKDLNKFLCANWKVLFPEYTFIKDEFPLKGDVHGLGKNGRIDILAYNPTTKRFVFFELKRDYDKNIGHQAANYRLYIRENFLNVYVDALQEYKAKLPDKTTLDDKEVEVILVAKEFSPNQISEAKSASFFTLIKYKWFEKDLLFLDYVHSNAGKTGKVDSPQTQHANKKTTNKRGAAVLGKRIKLSLSSKEVHIWKSRVVPISYTHPFLGIVVKPKQQTWRSVYIEVCQMCYKQDRKLFSSLVKERPTLFGTDQKCFRVSHVIAKGIYADTNMGANVVRQRLRAILKFFSKHKPRRFRVTVK